jgi:hypothetical protein
MVKIVIRGSGSRTYIATAMRGRIAPFLLVLLAALPSGAAAMTMPGPPVGHCRIVAGENFLTGDASGKMVCAEIEQAVAAAAPKARYSAEVRAMPRARLSARLVVNGRTLPEQNFAVMDHNLDLGSIRRFAAAVAAAVAKAAQ